MRLHFIFGLGLLALSGTCVVAGAAEPAFHQVPLNEILKDYVKDGRVAYVRLKTNRSSLDHYVQSLITLKESEYAAWDEAAKIAFWLNAYNAITLQLVIDHYPIQPSAEPDKGIFPANSIRQIPGVWDKITRPIFGRPTTLNQMEHEILRKQFKEPRIQMALVCAAKGASLLRGEAYEGKRLNEQLEDQTRRFLADLSKFRIDKERKTVWFSPIFLWFREDFLEQGRSSYLGFVSRYLSAGDQEFLKQEKYRIKYLEYDWSLNEAS